MNLGGQLVHKQPGMPSSSCASWKPAGAVAVAGSGDVGVPDQFPAGLRVLVVDDDPTCLMILEKMLRNCNYEATKCKRAEVALSFLRENKNGFDIVLSDVHMPDMDGFKLLEHIGLEMDLPVIMMSADDSKSVVMKGVTHGACDYLIKPVRIEALRNIWQHVVRKRCNEWKDLEPSASGAADGGGGSERRQRPPEDPDCSSSANEGSNWRAAKRQKDDDDEAEDRDDSSSSKKPRVVWSVELHQQFVAAVNQLGIDKAVPKKILELMNVPGLTRENVASHLQKYRLYLRRLSGSHHSGAINAPFMGTPDAGYGPISSLHGLDIQALAASGQLSQLPAHSLATLQAAALVRPNTAKLPGSGPVMDQRNIFSFENPNPHSGGKPMSLLHGIPTNMEPKQLVGLHQSSGPHPFAGMNGQVLVPMTGHGPSQSQSQSQTASGINHGFAARPPVVATARGGPTTAAAAYNSTDLTGSQFPIGGGLVQGGDGGGVESQGSRGGLVSGYDFFNDFSQSRSNKWGFDGPQQNFSPGPKTGWRNGGGGKAVFSAGEETGTHRGLRRDTDPGDNNPSGARPGSVHDAGSRNGLYSEHYDPDDLLNAILKQQQQEGGFGQPENEFGFDLPV